MGIRRENRVMVQRTSLARGDRLSYRSCVPKSEAKKAGLGRVAGAVFSLIGFLLACDGYSEIRASLSPADQARFARGQREATACWSCHDVTGSALKVGPPLGGIMGRRVGSSSPFPYSDALRHSGLVWTKSTLDAFLASPQRLLPGNRMISPALGDSRRRGDLVFFLTEVWSRDSGPNAP